MTFNQYEKKDFTIIQIIGRIDASNSQEAQKNVLAVIDGSISKLILNLEKLDYISSAGLRALLIIAKTLKAKNGVFRLCCLKENIKEVFDISGFSTIFDIRDNEQDSLND